MITGDMAQPTHAFRSPALPRDPWTSARSSFAESYGNPGFSNSLYLPSSVNYPNPTYSHSGMTPRPAISQALSLGESTVLANTSYNVRPSPAVNTAVSAMYNSYQNPKAICWESQGGYSPTTSLEDLITSPNLSDYSLDNALMSGSRAKPKANGKRASQRRPSNRDEFDGPHQLLQRPPPDVIKSQERELPHLPTNLHVQEQDHVLNQVNDRLSQCAYDFVAKYQFPIPLTQDMRPVERPQDREWTEWVYLLKRLATKRRIPARVLYNGQIKQLVTILENSLEMRHAAKHQSRPLKDDRNILQLISAGIQVAKILKDASAMEYLDRLYVETDKQIQERANLRFRS
ncbi:hypothetical protein CDD81_4141 [Ophiocordyceps australis]|uniref:Uncharacterized protein n=1 Tax=Ophiocordyceps australis TaxID=1399860 RepID=A0A2C5YB59_9HYPO|nr:hypothetical protein CDD81_4141 [Ophiocordyceps australis]